MLRGGKSERWVLIEVLVALDRGKTMRLSKTVGLRDTSLGEAWEEDLCTGDVV